MSEMVTAAQTPDANPQAVAPRVLLVDDEQNVLKALRRVFRNTNWQVDLAASGPEALQLMEAHPADVVISDYRMPGMTGVELLRHIKERWPDAQRIMLTGQADQQAIMEAINRSEIYRFLSKPWDDADLLATVGGALQVVNLARENRRLLQLTLQKNEELAQFNASLEAKVRERTALLTRSKREWEAAFDALDIPLAIVDGNYSVRRANRAWLRRTGLPTAEALQKPCYATEFGLSAPCPGCPLEETLATGTSRSAELNLHGRQLVANIYPWPDNGEATQPGGPERAPSEGGPWAVVTYRDVTDERRASDWRLRTERLAAVGRLAGGVAHEINNPLSGVLGFAQIMLRTPGRDADDEESLKLIEESALRCKGIVESLLRFAGSPGESTRRPTDLRRVTQDTLTLFRSQLKSRPRAKLELEPEPAEVAPRLADPHALGQALMDLLHHRLRALPHEGGRLSLALWTEGQSAGWRLTDSAPALGPAELERLVDPAVSDGSGLGLAFRIVTEHLGRIDITPGAQGNTFVVTVGNLESKS